MFDGSLISPLLPSHPTPIGPHGQFALFVLICFLLVAVAYFFFEMCAALMSEELWREQEQGQRKARKKE